jgi:glycosyltransferase involved in cell wall biosynthesis
MQNNKNGAVQFMKVDLIVPCYNEEASLPALYEALKDLMDGQPDYSWEVLMVNDGSRDDTINEIKRLRQADERICYVDLSRNFGKENAMLAGFDYATGDATVIMDADLQDPPSLIPEMIKYWEEGYDDVYALRKDRGKESWLRKKLSLAFYDILQRSTRIEVLPNVGDFRLLDRSCIEALKKLRESERYTKGMFCWIGFRKKEIKFDRGNRTAGNSSWNFFSLFGLAIEGITSFTTVPLRFATIMGVIVSLTSFIYIMYIILKVFLWGEPVQGYPSMMCVILFLGGVQLLSLGIIGEYLSRVFCESKNRPTYIARDYNGEKIYK